MDTFGYVYENNFTLFDLTMNKIMHSDDDQCSSQFTITLYREIDTSFILIVTTQKQFEHDVFSIIVTGPSNVSMERIGTHNYYDEEKLYKISFYAQNFMIILFKTFS